MRGFKQDGVDIVAMGFNSVSSIAKAEIGVENKHFNLEHLYKIAKILEIDLCAFIQESGVPPSRELREN
ncbi:MAG: hypothetical protein QG558_189 [Campylobacterota bacterium]|nr:hypothetical protein [Campylobacterota bacterium]